jgi:hypothetical protein
MSEKTIGNITLTSLKPAEIARQNNWQVGDVISGTEALRVPLIFEITAIGTQLVLGVQLRNKVKQEQEIRIPLNDPFIMWRKEND